MGDPRAVAGHVFISYSRRDIRYVDELVAHLAASGVPYWVDHKIDYGDQWEKVIREKVDTCALLVVVMTPDAEESPWVTNELERARFKQKKILPLLLSGDPFFSLLNTQFEDVTGRRMPSPAFVARIQTLLSAGVGQGDTAASATTLGDGGTRRTTRAPSVGIEMGTSNSMVSVLKRGRPIVIPNAEGSPTTPSTVAFAQNGDILVGEPAKRQAVTNPDRTIRSVIRVMGSHWTVDIDGTTYSPQRIAARLLMKLKRDAEAHIDERIVDVVITVPASFDDAQRRATVEAGEIAGLRIRQVLDDTTAAGVAYVLEKGIREQTVLIFDLGGGTLSVAALKIAKGVVDVIARSVDNHLGGDDWDVRLIDHLVGGFQEQHAVDLNHDPMAMQRLRAAAEAAKIELSTQTSTSITLPFVTIRPSGSLHLDADLTRAEFQLMTQDLVDRCKASVVQALTDARPLAIGVDRLILAGGSSRMPAVIELVTSLTGMQPYPGINPDEVVAFGAAWRAGMLAGEVKSVQMLDSGIDMSTTATNDPGQGG